MHIRNHSTSWQHSSVKKQHSVLFVCYLFLRLVEMKGLVSAVESSRPAGLQLRAAQRSAYPPLRNHQCTLMSPSTSHSHRPIRANFPVAGSNPQLFELGVESGPSLLQFSRSCRVPNGVTALMYFEPVCLCVYPQMEPPKSTLLT